MSRAEGVKHKVAGKTKRLVGEVIGDQALHDQGKEQASPLISIRDDFYQGFGVGRAGSDLM